MSELETSVRDAGGARAHSSGRFSVPSSIGPTTTPAGRLRNRTRLRAEGCRLAPPDPGADAAKPVHEVLDHPVGVGMVDVEPIQLAVGGEIDAGLPLEIEDDARGIDQGLLGRQRRELSGIG